MSLRLLLTLSPVILSCSQWTTGTWTTGYWDCCKPSCSWPNKGSINHPVPSCNKETGLIVTDPNEASVCDGGTAASCTDNQPFVVNDGLSMGFAAAAVGGVSGLNGDENCGQCYELLFTGESHFDGQWSWGGSHPDLVGKTHVVQITNIGYDVSGVHSFDLQIPGSGMGQFQNGCPNQYPSYSNDAFDCGNHYGGCSSISGCGALPQELQRGCEWRYNWYKWLMNDGKTNNPYVTFRRVKCPSQITDITGTVPLDDDSYPSINIDDYDSGSRRRSTAAATTEAPTTAAPTDPPITQAATTEPLTDPPTTQAATTETFTDLPSTQAAATKAPTTTPATSCSVDGADRWGPNLGGCCNGLQACREPRPVDASRYCAPSDPQHGQSCWSTITMCRSQCAQTTTTPPRCSGNYEDCRKTQCCNDAGRTCYSKNEWWAQCKRSCVPGINPADSIRHRTPWSCVALPVAGTTTSAPSCSVAGVDRWGPDLGGCCDGLRDCVEARSVNESYYCSSSDPSHGSSCWSSVVVCRSDCAKGGSRLLHQGLRR